MPRTEWNRKGPEQTIRSMPRRLVALADDTRLAVLPDERPEFRPSILASNEGKCAVLTEMTGQYVIMHMLKNTYS
jgi:hypothetical protein